MASVPAIPAEGPRTLAMSAAQDLIGGLCRTDLWGRLGWLDVKRRYRRTMLGPFWTSISLGIYVVCVGVVGAGLWHQDIEQYVPFLVSGMIAWLLVSTIINESCTLLVAGHALFRNVRFEYSILAYALVWRNFIVFFHNLLIYVMAVAVLQPRLIGFTVLLALPGILLVAANGVWVALLCGMFCLRFRDVTQIISSVLQISMFITPIFWPPGNLSGSRRLFFVETNPLYHMINLVRAPLLGEVPSASSYAVVLGLTVLGWILTYRVFKHFRKRIAYWS
ncbi:MAG TPA: ABC transporter permease [Xanthobacteraceae bacterium]|nr:ABC transporter permease [Xanthobacteraceae bacterium]